VRVFSARLSYSWTTEYAAEPGVSFCSPPSLGRWGLWLPRMIQTFENFTLLRACGCSWSAVAGATSWKLSKALGTLSTHTLLRTAVVNAVSERWHNVVFAADQAHVGGTVVKGLGGGDANAGLHESENGLRMSDEI
jgi:hypothetical protein